MPVHPCLVTVSLTLLMPLPQDLAPQPPVARTVPHTLVTHGHERVDEYYWLNQREDPEVIAYLEAENAYTAATLKDTEALQETLFQEMRGRVRLDESSVPYRLWDHWYYQRMEPGRDYPIHCRRKGSLEAPEQVLVDVNEVAAGEEYCSVRPQEISPGQDRFAYAVDTVGRRFYTLRFRDLRTGRMLPDEIPDVTGNMVWAADNRTVFYTRQDPQTLRAYQVYRHVLGTDVAADVLVYQEDDEEFRVGVGRTTSREYLWIGSFQTLADEYRILPADQPEGEWRVFLPREPGHEHSLDHLHGRFFLRTNRDAVDFRLVEVPGPGAAPERWQDVVPARADVHLEDCALFRDHLVLLERRDGLRRLRIRRWDGKDEHDLDFGEPAYRAGLGANPDWDTTSLRYTYTSLTTPESVYDYDMDSRERTLRKRREVLGGFDPADYVSERVLVTARDGTRVPVSLVRPKDQPRDGSAPLLLYGYGSYGMTIDAAFQPERLSLLERGFTFAIAHVRGSQVFGRPWYEDGRLLRKRNTFTDFVDVARHLVDQDYTSPERLYAMGGSAGGLLMGAVINMAPELFHGVVAAVPFVDVVTTMLDDSIPLTTFEYDEWGNPNEKHYYDYMLSYSPYDNVREQDYPHLLVTTGLHDSQVQYWEPAKWVARLRATKTDEHLLLLKCDMEAGHGGASGRRARWRELALDYAFLLDLAGVRE